MARDRRGRPAVAGTRAARADAPDVDRYFEDTASASPETRADAVARAHRSVRPGLQGSRRLRDDRRRAGAREQRGPVLLGARRRRPRSQRSSPGPTAAAGSPRSSRVRPARSTPARSVARAQRRRRSGPPRRGCSTPATYTVVLEPAATATLVGFLAWVGFAGRAYIEGRSCFDGKEGRQVAAPSVSIWDDGTDPRTLGVPFDFEGTPKQRVDLVRDGVFRGVVYDRRTGKEAGRAVDRPRPALAEPRGTLPAAPVHGHRRRDGRGDGPLDGARTARDHGSTTRTS